MSTQVSLCLIVVTYNSENTIRDCLDSLVIQISSKDKILVFDNGSMDGTKNILSEYESKVSLHFSKKNFGFSYACNWCAKQTNATHLAFINPDAVAELGLVDRARNTFIDSTVSLVGFSCKDENGFPDKNFRRYPSVFSGLLITIDTIKFKVNQSFHSEFDLQIHYLDGSCMFINRQVFFDVGLFHNLFLYGEDVILCENLRQRGIKAIYHKDIFYLHLRGTSSASALGERSWSMLPNMVYSELYYLRCRGLLFRAAYLILKLIELVTLVLVSPIFFSKNKMKITFFRKRLLLFLQYSLAFFIQGKDFSKPEFHVVCEKL